MSKETLLKWVERLGREFLVAAVNGRVTDHESALNWIAETFTACGLAVDEQSRQSILAVLDDAADRKFEDVKELVKELVSCAKNGLPEEEDALAGCLA